MQKFLFILALVLFSFAAQAQTPGAQPEFCVTSPSQTANYNQICLSASATGGNLGLTNFGAATGPLSITQNGVPVTPSGGVSIPASLGDGIQDTHPAFLAAVAVIQGSRTGCGTIYFPPGNYISSTAYAPPSCINMQGAGRAATLLKGNNNCNPAPCNTSLIIYGTLTGSNFTNVTTYAINVPSQGASTVTTTTPADAGNFTAGMHLMVSGSLHGTSFWYPSWTTDVVSSNAATGVVTLNKQLPLDGLTLFQSTVTITIAAPGIVTWNAHGFIAGTPVVFSNVGGALPTGITAGVTYFVAQDANLTTNTFDVSDTYAHALAGTNQVTTTGMQSGTQSATEVALTLIQQVVVQPTNITISDMTIVGTVDGGVQVQNAKDISFRNVGLIPGTGPSELGSLSIAGSLNILVSESFFLGGSYLECLGCFDSLFIGNMVKGGSIQLDGGTQATGVIGNNIDNPTINGVVNPCISIASFSQRDRIIGNSCTNAGPSNFGILVSAAALEGEHIISGNTISTTDTSTSLGIALANTTNVSITANNLNQAAVGVNLTNAVGIMLDANQMINVTTPYSFDAISTFELPTTPVKFTIVSSGTTPGVQGGYLEIFNSAPTSVTNFTGGSPGQVLTVYFGNANTTLVQGTTLNLSGTASYAVPSNTIMQFLLLGATQWYELSRRQVSVSQEPFIRGINAGASAFSSTISVSGLSTLTGGATLGGQIITTFGSPTIASGACGTGTNGTISGSNQAGIVTIGAASTTTCTISFSTTITAPKACVIFPNNATAAAQGTTLAWVGTPGTTSWTINGSVLGSTSYAYHCI